MDTGNVVFYNPFGEYSIETPEVEITSDLLVAGSVIMSEDTSLIVNGKVCWDMCSCGVNVKDALVVSGDLKVLKGQTVRVSGDCYVLGDIDYNYFNCRVIAGSR